MNKRILAFGDSIFFGAWDSQGGAIDRLKTHLNKHTIENPAGHKYQLYNRGIGGNTSADLADRIEPEIKSHLYLNWDLTFIVQIGKNDTRTSLTNTTPTISETNFNQNYNRIVKLLKRYSTEILIVGLCPVARDSVTFKDVRYHNQHLQSYNDIIRQVAGENGLPFLDLYARVSKRAKSQNLYHIDLIHFNDTGHKFLYEGIKSELYQLGFVI